MHSARLRAVARSFVVLQFVLLDRIGETAPARMADHIDEGLLRRQGRQARAKIKRRYVFRQSLGQQQSCVMGLTLGTPKNLPDSDSFVGRWQLRSVLLLIDLEANDRVLP